MKEIAIVGDKKFSLGFQIAGISKAFQLDKEHPNETINELISNPEIGIIIMQEKSLQNLDEFVHEEITNSVDPVFMVISEQENSNSELRKLIKKSIGVDLMKE